MISLNYSAIIITKLDAQTVNTEIIVRTCIAKELQKQVPFSVTDGFNYCFRTNSI